MTFPDCCWWSSRQICEGIAGISPCGSSFHCLIHSNNVILRLGIELFRILLRGPGSLSSGGQPALWLLSGNSSCLRVCFTEGSQCRVLSWEGSCVCRCLWIRHLDVMYAKNFGYTVILFKFGFTCLHLTCITRRCFCIWTDHIWEAHLLSIPWMAEYAKDRNHPSQILRVVRCCPLHSHWNKSDGGIFNLLLCPLLPI